MSLRRNEMEPRRSAVDGGPVFSPRTHPVKVYDATGQPSLPPAVRRLAGDAHLVSDVGNRSTRVDPFDEELATPRGQLGVSVHRSLLGVGGVFVTTTLSRRLNSLVDPVPCHQRGWRAQLVHAR